MILSDVSIKRPVLTVIATAALILFGAIAYPKLGVDLMPNIDTPFVTITCLYQGADPEVVENRIIKPIEDAVSSISGVKRVTATAVDSYGVVFIEFELDVPADQAAQDVREKVASVAQDLPKDAEAPVVQKLDIAAAPVLALALFGPPGETIAQMTYIAEQRLKPQLQRFDGVGVVDLVGKQTREIHIIADPARLRTFGLTLPDLEQAIAAGNTDVPGGHVTRSNTELLVKTHAEAVSLDQLRSIVVTHIAGAPITIRDVAQVEDSAEEARSKATFDGRPALTLLVRKQAQSNSVATAEEVMRAVTHGKLDIPEGYGVEVVQNSSEFTRHSLHDVQFDLILGAILAVVVILIFLRNVGATVISGLALPTSVIATFAFMQAMNFSLNNLTMLALSLSIGMLIDDAIVVIENIHRHMELGKSAWNAAKDGTAEIGLAVLATTASVIAVFVPVAFMKGMAGKFFFEFGLTVAFAMVVSLFVSFTLTPMLASRFLTHGEEGRLAKRLGSYLDRLDVAYRRAIHWVLAHRFTTLAIGGVAFVLSLVLAGMIPTEFQPEIDNGELDVTYALKEGTSLEHTFEIGRQIESISRDVTPELQHALVTVGSGTTQKVNDGKVFLKLSGASQRTRGQTEISTALRAAFGERLPGVEVAIRAADIAGGAGGGEWSAPLHIQLRGDDSVSLRETAQRLVDELDQDKRFVDLQISDRGARPQAGIELDRDKIAAAGLAPVQVALGVRTAITGATVSQYRVGSDRYDVVVKAPERYRLDERAIMEMPLRGANGRMVQIGELVRTGGESAPSQIDREDRIRKVSVTGSLEGFTQGEAQNHALALVKPMLPKGVEARISGMGEVMVETFQAMAFALLLAIILIYMVLAAQFESFVHPFTIMASLPLSVVGAFGALLIMGQTLSMMSFIGLIMLMGLVTKNAILLVDNANQRRADGQSVIEALVGAGETRLRPILMTTAAMIFGMLPVALALGEGSEQRAPMGVAVIGGLITSTLLTLFVVPVVYSLLSQLVSFAERKFKRQRHRSPEVEEAARRTDVANREWEQRVG